MSKTGAEADFRADKIRSALMHGRKKVNYKNYVFDLYGTLVDIRTDEDAPGLWEKLSLFYGFYDACYTPEELKKRYESLVEGEEADLHEAHPEIRIETVFAKLFEEKGAYADMTLAIHAGQFFRILSTEYVRLYDGATELLSGLKNAGKNVYLLSNAQRIFTEYELHLLGIADYFDDIFISSEFGVKKPEQRFFRMLMEKHCLSVGDTMMIGNDGRCDIDGAKSAGMAAFYIHSNISPELSTETGRDASGAQYTIPVYPKADLVLPEMDLKKAAQLLLEKV